MPPTILITMVRVPECGEAFDNMVRLLGLELARLADLPSDVLTEAQRVAETLATLHARGEEESEGSRTAMRRKAVLRVTVPLLFSLYMSSTIEAQEVLSLMVLLTDKIMQLRTQLKQTLDHSALPDQELLAYIRRFQDDIAKAFSYAR